MKDALILNERVSCKNLSSKKVSAMFNACQQVPFMSSGLGRMTWSSVP